MGSKGGRFFGSGAVFIALTLIGWSSVPLFLKYFTSPEHYIDGWTANGWRYGVAALIWAPVLLVFAGRRKLPRSLWRAALVPSLLNCLGQVCFAWAPYYIGPGLQSFLIRFQIIVVTLGAYLLFPSERRIMRTWRYWIGLAVVFGGTAGTSLLGRELPDGGTAFGIALGIISGLLFGGYALAVRYYMHGVNPIVSFGTISQYTAGGMIVLMLILADSHGAAPLSLPSFDLWILVASGVVGIALGHVFYFASIARLGVTVAAGVMLVAPFLTGTASVFLYNEHLTAAQWMSGIAALVGAAAVLRVRRSSPPTAGKPMGDDLVPRHG